MNLGENVYTMQTGVYYDVQAELIMAAVFSGVMDAGSDIVLGTAVTIATIGAGTQLVIGGTMSTIAIVGSVASIKSGISGLETIKGMEKPLPYSKSRPSYRDGVVEEVWEEAMQADGKVYDANTGELIEWTPGESRNGVWDMGHIEEQKYSITHEKYLKGEISKENFLDWYNDPTHYQVETPYNNRSHNFE